MSSRPRRSSRPAASPAVNAKRAEERAAEIRRILAILHKWGIHTLGQFAALEKQEVSARLGPEAVRMWERASGTATRLLKLVPPPESFAEAFEFEHEIETIEPILFMLRRFLQQLTGRLGALYLVAKELQLQITFSDQSRYERVFKIPEPCNNVEVLFRMVHGHLEDFTSDAPIIAVALEATPAQAAPRQFGLFETALRNPMQLSETLARLTGLLGAERVGTPVLQDTHRPDAFRMEPFSWRLPETVVAAGRPAKAALRRFRPAGTASVLLEGNQPTQLRSREAHGDVLERDGPYRLSGHWWEQNASWTRAEWDVQLASRAVCRCHEEAETWKLDGIYD